MRPRDEAGMTLTLLEAATSRVVDVAVLSLTNRRPGLTVSPDGRWVLYAQLDRSESDLMLVEGLR
jgi:hypothetical protein